MTTQNTRIENVTEVTTKRRTLTTRRALLFFAMGSLGFLNTGCLQAIQGAFKVAGEVLGAVGEIAEPVMGAIESFRNGDVAGGVGNILGAVGAGGNALGRVGGAIGELVERRPAAAPETANVRTMDNNVAPAPVFQMPGRDVLLKDAPLLQAAFRNPAPIAPVPAPAGAPAPAAAPAAPAPPVFGPPPKLELKLLGANGLPRPQSALSTILQQKAQ